MPSELANQITQLEEDKVLAAVKVRLEAGEDPLKLIEECREGMDMVGQLFQSGEYFLSELIISAEIFKGAMALVEPRLQSGAQPKFIGKVVLGTPKGDIHDIGKNIFAVLLKTSGFEVIDLGVDVVPERFVEAVRDHNAGVVGLSGLITPAFEGMKRAVEGLEEAGLRRKVKVIIGGGVTNDVARRYVGADAQTTDAMKGLEWCREWVRLAPAG